MGVNASIEGSNPSFSALDPASPFGGRTSRLVSRTIRVPAPPSYPRHSETRLRRPEAGFSFEGAISVGGVAPINVRDYERLAEEKLDANALAYFAGGAGDEITLRENVAAFERLKLRPRVLVDLGSVATKTTVLGNEISLPVLIAPLAMQRMAHPDGELA